MFGIGSTELLLILLVALVVLGPEHLPKIIRTINKVMSEFRKVSTELQRAVNLEAQLEDAVKPQKKKAPAKPKPKTENTPPAAEAKEEASAGADNAEKAHAESAGTSASASPSGPLAAETAEKAAETLEKAVSGT